ncbi:MAG: TetR/AcrR family transcriptional regulator [Roseibium sp.]
MARPREFDPDQAMDKAMELFWDVGYEEASLTELLGTMAISKGSFYKAFQDKHSVYVTALDRYDEKVISATVTFLGDPENGTGRERIISLFQRVEASALSDGDRLGCFLCNALVDKAAEGGEVEEKLQAMVLRLEKAFYRALGDEFREKMIVSEDILRETARGVLSIYFGLRLLGRAGLAGTMATDCVGQTDRLITAAVSEADGQSHVAN